MKVVLIFLRIKVRYLKSVLLTWVTLERPAIGSIRNSDVKTAAGRPPRSWVSLECTDLSTSKQPPWSSFKSARHNLKNDYQSHRDNCMWWEYAPIWYAVTEQWNTSESEKEKMICKKMLWRRKTSSSFAYPKKKTKGINSHN